VDDSAIKMIKLMDMSRLIMGTKYTKSGTYMSIGLVSGFSKNSLKDRNLLLGYP